jgi:hypothetical protein
MTRFLNQTALKAQLLGSPIVWVETRDGIKDPFVFEGRSYASIFEEHKDAEALWILKPDAREPYRVPFRRGPRRPGNDARGPRGPRKEKKS